MTHDEVKSNPDELKELLLAFTPKVLHDKIPEYIVYFLEENRHDDCEPSEHVALFVFYLKTQE